MTGARRTAPILWLLLALASAAGFRYAWRVFPDAFSLISLDLTMDRGQALALADSLAQERGWGPDRDVRTAASFDTDFEAQTFVELEGGGPAVFKALLRDGSYAAYTWHVRRFAPGELRETEVRFTPSGHPWGFRERIPEEEPGPALSREAALEIARAEVPRWGVGLADFLLVEQGQEARPSGRVDHTFTWERAGDGLGEGRLRLRVVIAGDRPIELRHFLQVPEAFTRRYAAMRAANDGIAAGALAAILLVYGLLGVGTGLFVMMRRRGVLWRPALAAGGVIAALQAGAFLSALPLSWIDYDTATPVRVHLATQAGLLVLVSVLTVLQVALTAAAAEALTRAAFPRHPQFWRLWSREAGASRPVVGATVLGYLLIGLDLAWIVWFSKGTRDWQGWWNPSDLLVQPDLLATAAPWLGPVALALQAGFWEECLFRAVPLAGAALLGDRFGRRGLWLAAAMVVQAVVFASGHANYPAQPAYARVVELIIPSLAFGAVYLRAGLLPAILMHFGYDLALMALPVFVSEAPGIWGSRFMVLAAGFLPLGLVAWRVVRQGGLVDLPDALRNGGWQAVPAPEEPPPAREATPAPPPAASLRWLLPAGAVGLVAWAGLSSWSEPTPRLEVGRAEAMALARDALAGRGTQLGPEWRALASVHGSGGLQHTFVWQTGGDSAYRSLYGSYLAPAHWDVRFARFTGDLSERAEEWTVSVDGPGRVARISHDLPEARAGASLPESSARLLADSALRASGRDPVTMDLVSIEPDSRVARTDWTVTYRDRTVSLAQGEARITVAIAGDQVIDLGASVHVPEAWEREWTRSGAIQGLVPMASGLLYALLLIAVLGYSVVRWTRHRLDVRTVAILGTALFPLALLELANSWPALQANFSTAEPWTLQAVIAVGGGVVLAALGVAVGALVTGLGLPARLPSPAAARHGVALGAGLSGLMAVARAIADPAPVAGADHLDAVVPALSAMLGVPTGFLVVVALVSLALYPGSRIRQVPGQVLWYLAAGSIVTLGVAPAGPLAIAGGWLAGAAALLAADQVGRRFGGMAILTAAATWAALSAVGGAGRSGLPAAWAGVAAGTVLLLLLLRALRPPAADWQ